MIEYLTNFLRQHPLYLVKAHRIYDFIRNNVPKKNTCIIDKNINKPFIFIVGSGRSGNTLLRRLLMEHFILYIPPETYVLPKIARLTLAYKWLNWESIVDLTLATFEYHDEFETFNIESVREFACQAKKWPRDKQYINHLIIDFYHWLGTKNNVESMVVGDKTPLNIMHLRKINTILPGANYIFLKRDGVDVCFSYLNSGIYSNIQDAAWRWTKSLACWKDFKSCLESDQYIEIKYEDILANIDGVLSDIEKKFLLPKRKTKINVSNSLGDVNVRFHHKNVNSELNTDMIGKGRRLIKPEEAAIIKPIIDKTLQETGYPTV